MALHRRTVLTGTALLAAPSLLRSRGALADGSVTVGVSGPLTGPNAQYGAQWKASFDLAIEQVAAAGGPAIRYVFEDSQSEPRQSVAIAQKFVNDPSIIMEIGDFSSPASMAASPIYQRAKLVQFGITNSHPDFTKGGDYMWSNSISQAEEQPNLADYAVNGLGIKKPAVLHLNTDWGTTSGPCSSRQRGTRAPTWSRKKATCRASTISAPRWSASAMPTPPGWCWRPTTPTRAVIAARCATSA